MKKTCFSSNRASEWGRKRIKVTLNVEWLLVPDRPVWIFQKLLIYWDIHAQQRIWHKNMKASCLVSTVQDGGGGVIVWGVFSWHTLGPLVSIEHRLNATAYLSIVADHVHPFMTTVYPSSDEYFQQDNAPCHKAQIISDWFLEHDNEFTLLKWPPQSPDLNPVEHFGMWWNERFTSWMCSRQICSNCVILSYQYGPQSLRNVSNTLLNLCHKEWRQFWRQKWVQPGTSKVYIIKWPVSVCIYIYVCVGGGVLPQYYSCLWNLQAPCEWK